MSENPTPETTENKEVSEEITPKTEVAEEVVPASSKFPELQSGYTVRLHLRINDGKKERVQIYEGMIIGISGATPETRTITVRKVAKGYGVEKIIPLAMPTLEKIEIVKKAKVRRSKLYYLRTYRKRLREERVLNK